MKTNKIIRLSESELISIVNESIRRLQSQNYINEDMTRSQVDSAFEDLMKSKEFEKRVNNIVVDTVGDFLESMWTKKSFWKTMLKRK